MHRLVILVGFVALALGACGDGGSTTTTTEPAFALEIDAPETVMAETPFNIIYVTDVPPGELEVAHRALLQRDGRDLWLLGPSRALRFPLPEDYGETREGWSGYGPWPAMAPPETGRYELCRSATWGPPDGENRVTACRPIEITTDAAAAAKAADEAVKRAFNAYPACTDVWVAGQTLPADYRGCRPGDGTFLGTVQWGCPDGTRLMIGPGEDGREFLISQERDGTPAPARPGQVFFIDPQQGPEIHLGDVAPILRPCHTPVREGQRGAE